MLPSPNPLPGLQESFAKRKDRLWKGTLHSAASVQNDGKGRRSMSVILSAAKNLFPQTPAKVVMQRSPGKRLSIFSILAPKQKVEHWRARRCGKQRKSTASEKEGGPR